MNFKFKLLNILISVCVFSCGKYESDTIPEALGSCGAHKWTKELNLFPSKPRTYSYSGWDIDNFSVSSALMGSSSSDSWGSRVDDPRCDSLDLALSGGINKMKVDLPDKGLKAGDYISYAFSFSIFGDDQFSNKWEDFDLKIRSSNNTQTVQKLRTTMYLGVGSANSSGITRGKKFLNVELNCNKTFQYVFGTQKFNANYGPCIQLTSGQYSCVVINLSNIADSCEIKAQDIEMMDEYGQIIKFDLGGKLYRNGDKYFSSFNSVTFK